MTRTYRFAFTAALAVAVVVLAAPPVAAQDEQVNERFTARAIAMGTSNPPVLPRNRTATVDINISRWTTDEEMEALFGALVEGGQPALVNGLRAQEETGWIRVNGPNASGSMTRFPRFVARRSPQSARLAATGRWIS